MKPPRFAYVEPHTVAQAVDFLGRNAEETKLLAGGQSLMPVLNMRLVRPTYVLDLNPLTELDYVRVDGDRLRIGALTRHDTLMRSPEVGKLCPPLTRGMRWVGHTAIRNRGTIGGSLVHADPAAEMPAVMVAMDAEMILEGPRGRRSVPASDFFLTYYETATGRDEILVEIAVPVVPAGSGTSVLEIARRHGDFALAGIVAVVTPNRGVARDVRLSAFGLDEVPRRHADVEALVAGRAPTADILREASELLASAVEPEDDIHATAKYRRDMGAVLTRRALAAAFAEAGLPAT